MNKAILFNFLVDKEKNQITVDRSFHAPLDLVWAAWTEAELLDQWWAPKPYQAITKSQDFREGGKWLYYMQGPTGDKHWCYFIYEKIVPMTYFGGHDSFCDENGNANTSKPIVHWGSTFNDQGESTLVNIVLQFKSLEDLEMIIQMGFKEGFTAGLENLDHYISTQFYLRQRSKPNNKARVSTYVNFPGNTEEAFLFYKSVFRTEFVDGIHRFGELALVHTIGRAAHDRRAIEVADPRVAHHRHEWHVVRTAHAAGHEMPGGEWGQNLARRRKVHLHTHQHHRVVLAGVLAGDVV